MKKIMKKRKGFTLVELVAVIAIIAILTAIALPRFTSVNKVANKGVLDSHFNTLKTAITLYQAENAGALPPSDSIDAGKALAKYVQGVPVDGNAFEHLAGVLLESTYTWDGTKLVCSLSQAAAGHTATEGAYEKTYTP